ncbi:MAG: gliding motility protein GldN, partial [Bacteroidales bacterium]|nr:gliding motility protein GldN [Bacteroidales bacterium]
MRKFGLLVLGLLLCGTANVNAQVMEEPEENLDGFYVKSSDAYPDGKKPFEYPYVREDDVVWSYRVWRVIDFREKMNQVFYYPLVPDQGRKNLTTILDEALTEGRIRAFEDDMFTQEITNWTEYKSKFGTTRTETLIDYDVDGMEITRDTSIFVPANFESAEQLRIKEDWFFDKNRTVEDVRIIGFSLVASYEKSEGDVQTLALGWIRYNDPEVRLLLANSEVY